MNTKIITVVAAWIFGLTPVLAQKDISDSLLEYNKKLPPEKVYIHFDNSSYLPGQTIGFKAYLLSGPFPSKLSYQLYTDWYDERGNLINHQVSPIALSSSFGTFTIPEYYTQERIKMVAYTKWMLNYDSAFLFRKTIQVIQKAPPLNKSNPQKAQQYRFDLLPEGGYLVNGLVNNIAFKGITTNGTPFEVQGLLLNQKQDTIIRFSSVHDGMGQFSFKPVIGESYICKWWGPDNLVQTTNVSDGLKEGVVVRMSPTGSIRQATIEFSGNIPDKYKKMKLLTTINQKVVLKANVVLNKENSINIKLPLLNEPSGIAVLTLLDINDDPILERPFFLDNENYVLDVKLNTDTVNYDKRGKNVYEILLPDTIPANMSLSVVSADIPDKSSDNMITHLLVNSELKGEIYNPGYYFDVKNDSGLQYLDLVMLTHGWRKIKWELASNPSNIKTLYPRDTTYLSLYGKIDGVNSKRLSKAQNINLIMQGQDSSRQMLFPEITPDGRFTYDNMVVFGAAKVFYQLNNIPLLPGKGNIAFSTNLLDSAFFNRYPFSSTIEIYDSLYLQTAKQVALEQERLALLMAESTLEQVTVKSYRKTRLEELDQTYSSGMFRDGDAVVFDVMNDPRGSIGNDIFRFLAGRVAGLIISFTTPQSASWRGSPVAFFLDELPVGADMISSITVNDVAYIKAFRPPFLGSVTSNGGGAIAVYTKKGQDFTNSLKGLDNSRITGFTMVKEFYQPDYSNSNMEFLKQDVRRTLFWKPNIITDGTEKSIKLSFYNNDISRKYLITLEGLNDEGKIVSIRKLLQE